MTESSSRIESGPVPATVAEHDHAWRKVTRRVPTYGSAVGEYECDLCSAVWSM